MKTTGLIGIGNPFMGDDGIGPLLIERLRASGVLDDQIRLIDGGTGGMSVVHELALLDAAVIVDAGDFGGQPGDYRIFSVQKNGVFSVEPGNADSMTYSAAHARIQWPFDKQSPCGKVKSDKSSGGFSIHEWDPIKTIELSMMMDELPQPLHIMVIQPQAIALRRFLSKFLQVRLSEYESVLQTLFKPYCRNDAGRR